MYKRQGDERVVAVGDDSHADAGHEQRLDLVPGDIGKGDARQTLRDLAHDLDTLGLQVHEGAGDRRRRHRDERGRPAVLDDVDEDEQRERGGADLSLIHI